MKLISRPDGLYRLATYDDQTVFSVYAASGGLASRSVAYLLKRGEGPMPESLRDCDLGLPKSGEWFTIFELERGWKIGAIAMPFGMNEATVNSEEPVQIRTCAQSLLCGSNPNRPPFETFKGAICRGCYALGTACGTCEKCLWERAQMNS